MRFYSYLNTAVQLLGKYQGEQPFSQFIKAFFAANKKYGSSDRKMISKLCYSYFRLGQALPYFKVEDRILAGFYLCSPEPEDLLHHLKPSWNERSFLPLYEKLLWICGDKSVAEQSITQIFPWNIALSEGIDKEAWLLSSFIQPDVYLRVRPGQEVTVTIHLLDGQIFYKEVFPHCISIPNGSRADQFVAMDKEAVIQDYNSQRVGEFMLAVQKPAARPLKIWDCCSGSGGKSIMAWDLLRTVELTVSDIRESILKNLHGRFLEAGIPIYTAFTADLQDTTTELPFAGQQFDLIIADVPCTGSGTWGRTPEQLHFFLPELVKQYASRQKAIVKRAIQQVAPGGYFLYITCSLFKEENEEVIAYIMEQTGWKPEKMELLKGYDKKADTLFAALFKVPE